MNLRNARVRSEPLFGLMFLADGSNFEPDRLTEVCDHGIFVLTDTPFSLLFFVKGKVDRVV